MARKFFNEKVNKRNISTSAIVVASIVGILIIIAVGLVISINISNSHNDAVIVIGDSLAVEINTKTDEIDKTLFFKKLENVKESDIKPDYDDVDISKIGKYGVSIKVYNKTYETILEIVDTKSPTLKTKDITISKGDDYKPSDFVKSCKDNSNEDCIIEYYSLSLSENGEKIDYASYNDEGTYTVKIVAKDESGNTSSPMSATLTIGSSSSSNNNSNNSNNSVKNCKYGSNMYDTSKYILAIDITDDGCGIDLNRYQDEDLQTSVNELINADLEKIKKEFNKISLGVSDINFHSEVEAVLNTEGSGIVGYTILITVSINKSGTEEVIEQYNLKEDGSRNYIVNKYL